ncbi:MAG: tetratricopeptide repeat protein [Terriglobales bacterium]
MLTIKQMRGGLMSAAVVAALLTLPALAQFSGGIKGRILDTTGKPLANGVITFARTDMPAKYTVKTNKKGDYGIYSLPVGTYDMSLAVPGATQIVQLNKGIQTHLGQAIQLDVNLKVIAAAEAGEAPPPGMSKEEAAAYEKKVKEQEDKNKKLGTLNGLLAQNKEFVEAKQYDQAIAVMEKAVTLDQKHDILYANLANDYEAAKQYDKAADAYQKAIALKPTDAGYLINLGTVLSKSGKIDEANAEFAKAAQMDPKQAKMAMYNSAVILMNQGNMQAAGAAFDKLLVLDPANADAWYYKGICMLGQATTGPGGKLTPLPGTIDALEKSIKLAPDGPNSANAKAALKTLQGGSGN